MKKLLCGACMVALSFVAPVSAMSYINPANVTAACTILSSVEQTVLADEALANQIAGKPVVRTGATATIVNVTPALCQQLGGVATTIAASALARAPTPAPAAPASK
jgi:hypothetical protein